MILKGLPQIISKRLKDSFDYLDSIKDQVNPMRMGGVVKKHMMPDGSMMLDSAMKKGGKVKHKKGSKAMKDHMKMLRKMRK